MYIEYTSCSSHKRIIEHKKDTEGNSNNTSLSQRIANFKTVINWDDAKVIRKEYNPLKGRIAEMISIIDKKLKGYNLINTIEPNTLVQHGFGARKNENSNQP